MNNKDILVTITGTWSKSHYLNWIECESTWVPKLREKGFDVLYLMSNPYLNNYYEKIGNFFFSNCKDGKDELYYKNHYYISKYLLEETNYTYRLHIDNDTFIHPERIVPLIEHHTSKEHKKDLVGCTIPYPGFNANKLYIKRIDDTKYHASGGSGFLISRRAHNPLFENFKKEDHKNLGHCDFILTKLIREKGLDFWHDSRFLFVSPWKNNIKDPNNVGIPFIGDNDSFLAIQHYCNGHMKEIMDKLEL